LANVLQKESKIVLSSWHWERSTVRRINLYFYVNVFRKKWNYYLV